MRYCKASRCLMIHRYLFSQHIIRKIILFTWIRSLKYLNNLQILKLYAWEPSFQNAVKGIRDKEIQILRQMGYLAAGTSFVWACAPFLVSLVTFATYVLSSPEHILDAERAFVALSLFNILRFPLSMLPMMISSMVQVSQTN